MPMKVSSNFQVNPMYCFSEWREKDQQYINVFLSTCGIRRLTECIKITPQTENFRPCPSLQSYVRKVVPWIQRQLFADEYREIYDFLTSAGIKARLAAMTFAQVKFQQEKCVVILKG
jgi:hypothetical protein